ncbi:MAG: hypothetical protein ACO36E_07935 [Synechocystis sp.]
MERRQRITNFPLKPTAPLLDTRLPGSVTEFVAPMAIAVGKECYSERTAAPEGWLIPKGLALSFYNG